MRKFLFPIWKAQFSNFSTRQVLFFPICSGGTFLVLFRWRSGIDSFPRRASSRWWPSTPSMFDIIRIIITKLHTVMVIIVVKLQYMGKLLFWTFMSIVPDAPASGRSLHNYDPGLLTEVMTRIVIKRKISFVVMLLLVSVMGMRSRIIRLYTYILQ